ncbi:DUF2273 domain-containing protein [Paenibacillus sp. CMAA1364]
MYWKEVWESHGGRIGGLAGGIALGIVYLISGFWDMLFFALVVFIGYIFGKRKDLRQESPFQWRETTQWLSEKWRLFK